MKMTTSTTPTINSAYPPEVLKGGGAAMKWISALTRAELHLIVQDKQLPIALIGELVKNVPVKYLRNLVHHKKCTSELRITVLRRIYRAKPNEMKIPDRIQAYNSILKIKDLSDKERRITNSYIRELERGNHSKDLAQPQKPLKKTSKKPKRKKQVIRKELPPVVIRDSTTSEVVKFLRSARSQLIAGLGENSKPLIDCRTQAGAMISDSQIEFENLATKSVNRIDIEDLLSYRIELNAGLYLVSTLGSNEEFIKNYKQINRGDVAKDFFTGVNIQNDSPEILYELLVKASSLSQSDFESKLLNLQSASQGFSRYLEKIPPQLNYGQVAVTTGGIATITFSTSLNLEFAVDSFKYWESEQDESFAFPIKFKVEFDRNRKLNTCTVTVTNLLPGMRYMYALSAVHGDRLVKLEPREFKVPDLPAVEPSRGYERGDYRDYGAPVPLGGGGERRFSQF
jgi:hypothetical protein